MEKECETPRLRIITESEKKYVEQEKKQKNKKEEQEKQEQGFRVTKIFPPTETRRNRVQNIYSGKQKLSEMFGHKERKGGKKRERKKKKDNKITSKNRRN